TSRPGSSAQCRTPQASGRGATAASSSGTWPSTTSTTAARSRSAWAYTKSQRSTSSEPQPSRVRTLRAYRVAPSAGSDVDEATASRRGDDAIEPGRTEDAHGARRGGRQIDDRLLTPSAWCNPLAGLGLPIERAGPRV